VKGRLIAFLLLFPSCLWLLEYVFRWALSATDSDTFLAPAISVAAIGMIGPVAVQRDYGRDIQAQRRDGTVCFWGLVGLVLGTIAWCLCLAINIKQQVPPVLMGLLTPRTAQFGLAMLMYVIAMVLTMAKEGN
jgi:hypothetical protein